MPKVRLPKNSSRKCKEVQRIIEQHVAVAQLWWKKCKCQQLSKRNEMSRQTRL